MDGSCAMTSLAATWSVCVRVRVCVCARASERESERLCERGGVGGLETESAPLRRHPAFSRRRRRLSRPLQEPQ